MHFFNPHFLQCVCAFAAFLSSVSNAQKSPSCPLLGPVFPIPAKVANTSAVQKARTNFASLLQNAISSGTSLYGNLDNRTTSFYLKGSLTSGQLDENTIFRIGSISKLLTVYTVLAESGTTYLNDPVTKWVPELAAVSKYRNVTFGTQWDQITIAALASHMAGLPHDITSADYGLLGNAIGKQSNYSIPPLPADQVPTCGESPGIPMCTRQQFFQQFASVEGLQAITKSFRTPMYSNIAFQILAYALEGITNKPFATTLNTTLLEPLDMTKTYLYPPPTTEDAIIPFNESASWWIYTLGDGSPFGGMYSTAADIASMGRSILNSALLSSNLTRAWMKPVTHTSDLHLSVGMPWEIIRRELPLSSQTNNTRIIDLYTKDGSWGDYGSYFVLDSDHGIGFVILAAGSSPLPQALNLAGLAADTWVLALEEAAREQAMMNFAGRYISEDPALNSSITIALQDSLPGLGITNWISNNTDFIEAYVATLQGAPQPGESFDLRLYPMELADNGQVAFRAMLDINVAQAATYQSFLPSCTSWADMDTPTYGNVGFDDVTFNVDPVTGRAQSINLKALRATLRREE